jgi:hypothetical protein
MTTNAGRLQVHELREATIRDLRSRWAQVTTTQRVACAPRAAPCPIPAAASG